MVGVGKMRALQKDFLRGMVHNRGRFLSVFFIVALGAAFFFGLRSSRRDMLLSADAYFDRTNLMDLRVIGSLGLTDDDLADIRGLEGVHAAFGLCSVDVLCRGEQDWAVRLMSFEMGVNSPVVVSGRVPLEQDECLVDAAFARSADYRIGDEVDLVSGGEDDLEQALGCTRFTIVGLSNLPTYMDLNRGTGSVGNGTLDGFILVRP